MHQWRLGLKSWTVVQWQKLCGVIMKGRTGAPRRWKNPKVKKMLRIDDGEKPKIWRMPSSAVQYDIFTS